MQTYTIKIHSFVDLITNSSTEIYIAASEQTVKSVKELIDSILTLGGSALTADELFDIKLDPSEFENENGYASVSLTVKAKTTDEPAAKILSRLTSLFEINASYNG